VFIDWIYLLDDGSGGGGDNWSGAIGRAKLQSNHYHQQTKMTETPS